MAQRIAKRTTRGVSVWDVHVPMKNGYVDFSDTPYPTRLREWLGWMLNEGRSLDVPDDLTWDASFRALFAVFQKHNEMKFGSTILDNVPMLHFLKFSMVEEGRDENGQPLRFFCFSTQFDDTAGEQVYIDDMYGKYGALMEVIWRHCRGVTKLLKSGPDELPDPRRGGPGIDVASYALADEFLQIVDVGNVDRDGTLCFYNSNRDVSSSNVKIWQKDSDHLGEVKIAAGRARDQIGQGVPCQQILDELLQSI